MRQISLSFSFGENFFFLPMVSLMVIENICSCLFFIVSIISILFRADWINKTKPGRRLRHWFLQTDFFLQMERFK